MKNMINRRDFLKLTSLLSLSLVSINATRRFEFQSQDSGKKNVLIIVLDALSAKHIALYGYSRETMPNLTRLAEKAVVFHRHYSGGNFTTPGTASLLTGTLPWTHRATKYNDKVRDDFVGKNIFSSFQDYYRTAYTHNGFANTLLKQLSAQVDAYIPLNQLFLQFNNLVSSLFTSDEDTALLSWNRALNQSDDGFSYSLYLPKLIELNTNRKLNEIRSNFPRDIPHVGETDNYFLLEHAIDYLMGYLLNLQQPFLGYFHFLPPHDPYNTRQEFVGVFSNDNHEQIIKPRHLFSREKTDQELSQLSTTYDEYILYADAEFARLYKYLEQSGMLENTWLILTSDHGELFERGINGHQTRLLYEPIVRIPLLIFEPGRQTGLNIDRNTSAIDLMPTLLKVTGHEVPAWIEGKILPPYATIDPESDREIFSVQARENKKGQPINEASIMLVKENYKLIYYFGYEELGRDGELVELYDLDTDPEEINNLYPTRKNIANELLEIVKANLRNANQRYD